MGGGVKNWNNQNRIIDSWELSRSNFTALWRQGSGGVYGNKVREIQFPYAALLLLNVGNFLVNSFFFTLSTPVSIANISYIYMWYINLCIFTYDKSQKANAYVKINWRHAENFAKHDDDDDC